jgi:TetR/AcrR family transcriptional repressor of nem operon
MWRSSHCAPANGSYIHDDHHLKVNWAAENPKMRVSREQMAENRSRILEAAGRLFRASGFDAISVADVMKAAGLTHGGFYGHFSSKDDLLAKTLAHVLAADASEDGDFSAYLDAYLAPEHRDNAAAGCPTAAMAADVRHQAPAARLAMTEGLRSQIDRVSAALPAGAANRRSAAIGSWAAMVGAVILARAIDDPALSNEILKQTRVWIKASIGGVSAG